MLPTATLGGTGIVGGDALVAGTLAPGDTTGAPGTLTINGSLTLGNAAKLAHNFGQAGVVGGPLNDPDHRQGQPGAGWHAERGYAARRQLDPGV